MRKYQITYDKTGWETYIPILYQNTMEKAEIFFADGKKIFSLGPDEDRRTCWKLVSLINFSPVYDKIPDYIPTSATSWVSFFDVSFVDATLIMSFFYSPSATFCYVICFFYSFWLKLFYFQFNLVFPWW